MTLKTEKSNISMKTNKVEKQHDTYTQSNKFIKSA